MSTAPFRLSPIRWVSVVTFLTWGVLLIVGYGYVDFLEYAWGLNLLQYPATWIGWLLAGLALLIATEEARAGIIRVGERVASHLSRLPTGARDALLLTAAITFLWLVRDRLLMGGSPWLAALLESPRALSRPQTGGVFVLHELWHASHAAGLSGLLSVRFVQCVLGGASLLFVSRAAGLATTDGRGAAIIPLLVFSGGLAAAMAGRLEVVGLAIAASSLYLWRALLFLSGEGGLAAAALALGVAAWLQPACLLLLPGLVLLPRLAGRGRAIPTLGLALLPLALYVCCLLALNPNGRPPAAILRGALGGMPGLLHLWSERSGAGTDYLILGAGHLKYLANASFVLHPVLLPLGAALLLSYRQQLLGSQVARFIAASAAGLAVTALTIRPAWGPFDWDLFAVPALFAAFAVGMGVTNIKSRPLRHHVAVAATGLQLFFVGIPMLAIGRGAPNEAGPFIDRHLPPGDLKPWL